MFVIIIIIIIIIIMKRAILKPARAFSQAKLLQIRRLNRSSTDVGSDFAKNSLKKLRKPLYQSCA